MSAATTASSSTIASVASAVKFRGVVFSAAEVIEAYTKWGDNAFIIELKPEKTTGTPKEAGKAPVVAAGKKPVAKKAGVKKTATVSRFNIFMKSTRKEHAEQKFLVQIKMNKVPIAFGIPAPENQYEGDYVPSSVNVSDAPELGKAVTILAGVVEKHIVKMQKEGVIPQGKEVHKVLSTTYTDKNNNIVQKASPTYRINWCFNLCPDDYFDEKKRGKPRSEVLDATKVIRDPKGVPIENGPATIDGALLTKETAHKFVTTGSIVETGRLNASQYTCSSFGVAYRLEVVRAVVRHVESKNNYEGDDEVVVDDGVTNAPAAVSSSSSAPANHTATTNGKTTTTAGADDDAADGDGDAVADEDVDAAYDEDGAADE